MLVSAYAAMAAKQPLEPFSYMLQPLGPNDIEVAISHCGICYSDIHLVDNDWKISDYPLVPGHEIIGHIINIGSAVTYLQPGQRVGISWQCGACMTCHWCLSGKHNFCSRELPICLGHFGGFADRIKIDSRFAFLLPDKLDSAAAAPLLCGGATVYHGLTSTKPWMRVAIIGMGGLGHLAVQFAHAMGCEVSVFSSSLNKKRDAERFGATHFASSIDVADLKTFAGYFDFILSTVHVDLNWPEIIGMLKPYGQLCLVGIPLKPLTIPALPLILGNRSLHGCNIGNIALIQETLHFAARHNIQASIEVEPMHRVNTALKRVYDNETRYRMVLEN